MTTTVIFVIVGITILCAAAYLFLFKKETVAINTGTGTPNTKYVPGKYADYENPPRPVTD